MSYIFTLHDAETDELLDRTPNLWEEIYKEVGEEFRLPEFSLSITYNYTKVIDPIFDQTLKGMGLDAWGLIYAQWFHNRTAESTIPVLEDIISALGDQTDPDAFHATEGNAKKLLKVLLVMARLKPDAKWHVY